MKGKLKYICTATVNGEVLSSKSEYYTTASESYCILFEISTVIYYVILQVVDYSEMRYKNTALETPEISGRQEFAENLIFFFPTSTRI